MVIDGVSRKLVEEAQCGTYIEPEAPTVFAKAVQHYMNEGKASIQGQGLAGYTYAKAHFDRDVLAKKYISHLGKIALDKNS